RLLRGADHADELPGARDAWRLLWGLLRRRCLAAGSHSFLDEVVRLGSHQQEVGSILGSQVPRGRGAPAARHADPVLPVWAQCATRFALNCDSSDSDFLTEYKIHAGSDPESAGYTRRT